MTERPILFSGAMVRALLAGSKTQTRRVVKPQFDADADLAEDDPVSSEGFQMSGHSGFWRNLAGDIDDIRRCPYGAPGDMLYVRETFRFSEGWDRTKPSEVEKESARVWYEADAPHPLVGPGKTRVSIHMPRWASRITLRITDVRVERLNEIRVSDCYAEGCFRPDPARCLGSEVTIRDNARGEYRRIWERINGPGSWAANPFVWAVTFERTA